MRLQDKVVLVTGAASGIGHAVAELFAKEGASVIASDIQSPVTPYSTGIEAIELDVTSEENWSAAVGAIVGKHGRLDVLINNAGIIAYEPLHELGMEAWQRMIAVDQTGVFLGMREAVRVMRQQTAGSIINISSIWGNAAVAGAHSYHAAKGAVRNMSKNAAMTYVTEGIRVNSVSPGPIRTKIWESPGGFADSLAEEYGMEKEAAIEHLAKVVRKLPLGRMGSPADVAAVVMFLASEQSAYVTGSEYGVNGGSHQAV